MTLFPHLLDPPDGEAVRIAAETLSYPQLSHASAALAPRLEGIERLAVWAAPSIATAIGLIAAVRSGTTVVPVNPGSGEAELAHVAADSASEAIVVTAEVELPPALAALPRIEPEVDAAGDWEEPEVDPGQTAMIFYTSGTTDKPKGVLLPRRAVAANLDALAEAWEWTDADRLVHALPLFHVHGLVLGLLGPLRLGGQVEHLGRFSPEAIGDALERGGTMTFGVPTMYGRLADAAERDPGLARSLAGARLLVSGSAALPATVHQRIEQICGQRVVERYGMTETLMITAIRADGERAPGYVGGPLPGVEVELFDDDGGVLDACDDETIGEIAVRSPNLFKGYLNREDATAEAFREDWFLTGDLATRAANGYLRIVGRRSTDIIKSGGYKIGALEIEGALLEHRAVAEVAVAGLPDEDLGERIAAWVVLAEGRDATPEELTEHTRRLLSSHKRAREVYLVDALPRNAMGKVKKRELSPPPERL